MRESPGRTVSFLQADSANELWKPPDLAPHLGVPGVWLQMELVRRKLYCAKKTQQKRL